MDQAFASALRQAGMQRRILTGEALALSRKLDQFQQTVAEDQAHVQSLTHQGTAARGAASISAADDLDIAKAQLGLDSDQLADAQQDLARAGGDERIRIQQELAAHEAAMHKYDAEVNNRTPVASASTDQYGTLARCINAWIDQGSRYQVIQHAMQQAEAEKSAELAALKSRTAYSQLLGIYDDRIQSQQQLAAVYRKWSA